MNTPGLRLALAIWFAGLGAAGQFARFGVVFDLASARFAGEASPAVLGLLVSGVGLVGLLFGSTAGILIARFGARRAMIVALAAGAAFSFVGAVEMPLAPLLALRFLEGFSHLTIVVAGPVLITEETAGEERAFAMTLWSTFFGVAFAIVAWAGRPLALAFGLPALFVAHGVYMAAMAALMALVLPPERPRAVAPRSFAAILGQHVEIYASPFMAAPALGFMFYTLMYVAVLALLPPLGGEWQVFLATAAPLASIAASLTIGVRLLKRHSAVRVVQWGFAAAAAAGALMWAGWHITPVMLVSSLLFSASVGVVQSGSFSCIPELNDEPEARAAATGAIAQLGNVGTTTGTPALAALIAALGINGLGLYLVTLSLAGIAMHQWQKRRRQAAPGAQPGGASSNLS